MRYSLSNLTQPASEPVTLALAKAHLRIDHTAEDDLITSWIKAAREAAEKYTGRRFITQSLRMRLNDWPHACGYAYTFHPEEIRLPVEPVTAVTAFKYFNWNGVETTLVEGTDFQTWLDSSPPLIAPAAPGVWPGIWPIRQWNKLSPITIEFTAGGTLSDVPESVKTAMLLMIGLWDENRADQNYLIAKGVPPAACALLDSCWTGAYG